MTELEQYDHQLHFEHELINRRLTWLLTSQSILFAALAFVLGKEVLPKQQALFFNSISLLGILISLSILIGVLMGVTAKIMTWVDFNLKNPHTEKKQLGVRTWITFIALAPDIFMPIAFVIAWWCIWTGMG